MAIDIGGFLSHLLGIAQDTLPPNPSGNPNPAQTQAPLQSPVVNPQGPITADYLMSQPLNPGGDSPRPQQPPVPLTNTQQFSPGPAPDLSNHPGGFHGALKDILGTIGDALLVQGGADPIYGPGKALANYNVDPAGATQKLMVANPKMGVDLLDKQGMIQARRAQWAQQAQARQDAVNTKAAAITGGILQGVVGAIGKDGTIDPKTWTQAKQTIDRYNAANNVPDAISMPDKPDMAWLQATQGFGASTGQALNANYHAQRLGQIDRSLDISDRNADSRAASVGVAATNAGTNQGRLAEETRHHGVTESQGTQRINLKGPVGADFKNYEYRQKADGTWQRKPKS